MPLVFPVDDAANDIIEAIDDVFGIVVVFQTTEKSDISINKQTAACCFGQGRSAG